MTDGEETADMNTLAETMGFNWIKVVPRITARLGSIDLNGAAFRKDQKQTEKLSIAFNTFIQFTGFPVNLRYLEDLTKKQWSVNARDVIAYLEGGFDRVFRECDAIEENRKNCSRSGRWRTN